MDLAVLGKNAILVPTPGQTEQEYLANYHFKQGNFYTQKQNKFDLKKGLAEVEKYTPKTMLKNKLTPDFLVKNVNFV
jgi:hypothetical protein